MLSLRDHASYRRYCQHYTTGVLCLGIQFFGGTVRTWRPKGVVAVPSDGEPEELVFAINNNIPIYCHNTAFDRRLHEEHCVKVLGWTPIPVHLWRDTMALCAYYALPRGLDKAAAALGIPGKDKEGSKALLSVTKPRKPRKAEVEAWEKVPGNSGKPMPLLWHEEPSKLDAVARYCAHDVTIQTELLRQLGPMPVDRLKDWQFCFEINERGVYCDVENLRKADALIQNVRSAANQRLQRLTADSLHPGGRVESVDSIKQIRDWVDLQGFFISDVQKDTLEEVLSRPKHTVPANVREVLKLRSEVGKSSLSKIGTMLSLVDDDCRLRDGMVYHGASTGRLAGRAYQPHNFVRDAMKPEEADTFHEWMRLGLGVDQWFSTKPESAHVLTRALRSFLCAPPGKVLMISDFAAVEARVLAWLAGVPSLLSSFEKGECVYSQFASIATGKEVKKGMPERQLGKVAVLGLGYQMGWEKFITTAAGSPYNIMLTETQSKEIVTLYRSVYPEVPQLWRSLDKALKEAVRRKTTIQCGRLTVGANADWAWIILPSGRAIWYYKPLMRKVPCPWDDDKQLDQVTYFTVDSQTKQWRRTATYGGKITENVVQGIAGDLLMAAKKRVDEKGYPPILSVHDEVVSEVEEGYGSKDEFHLLMKVRPKWAATCPIECETHVSRRYGK